MSKDKSEAGFCPPSPSISDPSCGAFDNLEADLIAPDVKLDSMQTPKHHFGIQDEASLDNLFGPYRSYESTDDERMVTNETTKSTRDINLSHRLKASRVKEPLTDDGKLPVEIQTSSYSDSDKEKSFIYPQNYVQYESTTTTMLSQASSQNHKTVPILLNPRQNITLERKQREISFISPRSRCNGSAVGEPEISPQDLKRKKIRGQYKCGKCAQYKKDHLGGICPFDIEKKDQAIQTDKYSAGGKIYFNTKTQRVVSVGSEEKTSLKQAEITISDAAVTEVQDKKINE